MLYNLARLSGQQKGFSLLELVFGIVLLGIVITGSLTTFINLSASAVNNVTEVRSAQLAQHLLNNIASQRFDHANEYQICGDFTPCTAPSDYGPEADETRLADFNDVDDYDTKAICTKGLTSCVNEDWITACWFIEKGCSTSNNAYQSLLVRIQVTPTRFINSDGVELSDDHSAKHIMVSIKQAKGTQWDFSFVRGNYQ